MGQNTLTEKFRREIPEGDIWTLDLRSLRLYRLSQPARCRWCHSGFEDKILLARRAMSPGAGLDRAGRLYGKGQSLKKARRGKRGKSAAQIESRWSACCRPAHRRCRFSSTRLPDGRPLPGQVAGGQGFDFDDIPWDEYSSPSSKSRSATS